MCVAGGARAQSLDLFQVDSKNALTGATDGFNRQSCVQNEDHHVVLRVNGLSRTDYSIRFIQYPTGSPGSPCPTDMLDPLTEVIVPQADQPASGGQIDIENLTLDTEQLLGPGACSGDGERASVYFCAQITFLPGDTNAIFSQGIPMDYDTQLPPLPVIAKDGVRVGETKVTIDVETAANDAGDQYSYIAQYRLCPSASDGGVAGEGEGEGEGEGAAGEGEGEGETSSCGATGVFRETSATTSPQIVIGSLKAGQTIEYRVFLKDDFGNVGPSTALQTATTVPEAGALDVYDGAGSGISCAPSCGTSATTTTGSDAGTAGDAGAFLFVFGLTRPGRRLYAKIAKTAAKKGMAPFTGLFAVFFVVGALFASPAHADLGQLTLGMGISPYKPALDTEVKKSGDKVFPMYSCIFGGKTLTQIDGEVDEHLFDGFGSLQFAFGMDLSQAQGHAQDPSVIDTGVCGKATSTPVQLTMLKLRPGITYRFDPALDAWGVPLVPYARVGLVVAGYAFTRDGDFDKGNVDPVGLRFGWEAAGGMMLALDFLDGIDPFLPDTTKRGRADGTFDHTFLFGEAAYQPVDGFGTAGFVFSPDDVFIGTRLPIAWQVGLAVELL